MCGRYTLIAKAEEVEKRFGVQVPERYGPRHNAAPGQQMPVITNSNPETLSYLHWGLIPPWAKGRKQGALINARSETAAEKPSFRNSFAQRRCLVIADGFYEWKKLGGSQKQPYRIHLPDERLFAMAGLWESWDDDHGVPTERFTILTVPANAEVAPLHDRMPAILSPQHETLWIRNGLSNGEYHTVLATLPTGLISAYPVSTRVNNARIDNPELIRRAEPGSGQTGWLFDGDTGQIMGRNHCE